MATFNHFDLTLLNPAFDSPLVDVLTELEHLRRLRLEGTTPPALFYQLKRIFHMLESLGSARIEGNHTTLADYVENSLDASSQKPLESHDHYAEISNIESAMSFIDDHVEHHTPITEYFIRELHTLTVRNLVREGDATPGAYRMQQVGIAQSAHLPPEGIRVSDYMRDLVAFINRDDAPKYDLIKVALAHHRFSWIHPFNNGNGRVVRLLTYALLVKYGFNVKTGGRLLNPTAVFCNDRNRYYAMLSQADEGSPAGLEAWCHYVLQGVLEALTKVEQLAQYNYLSDKILFPALAYAQSRRLINKQEAAILQLAVKKGVVKASDLYAAMPHLAKPAQRTYQLKKLVDQNLLVPITPNARQYTLGFDNYLIRGVIHALTQEGFISASLAGGN